MAPSLIESAANGAALPAPHWFIQFFKVLGFTLHAVPMNLWYAGLLVALLLHLIGSRHGRRFAERLIAQMPVIIAFGVNLGIVPLLFIQVAYYKFFYPATILMAWPWLAIIVLLIPAYYGVYLYAWALRDENKTQAADVDKQSPSDELNDSLGETALVSFPALKIWRRIAGWAAAFLFIIIAFIFANGLSLMDHVDRWNEIWINHSVAGAALG
ncbi:MAG: hypothetical protein ACWGMZ_12365, partial [Thermoguttaceae bacterium]